MVWDYQRRHHPIRNCFGVFKNQPLPKKFMFCQNMQERDECSYQNACLFSHSITELAVWKIQKREGIKVGCLFFRQILVSQISRNTKQ